MLLDWSWAALLAALVALSVFVDHAQAERRAWPAWALTLGGPRQALLDWLRVNTGVHLDTLEGVLRVARDDHAQGRTGDALDVLGEAHAIAVRHVRLLRGWLQRWADVVRALSALAPAPPLPDDPSRLPPIRHLARLQRLGDTLLPTRTLRFRARVQIQRTALKWVGRQSAIASRRARHPGQLGQALDQFDAAHHDLVTLDSHALSTFEHVLLSLPEDARR